MTVKEIFKNMKSYMKFSGFMNEHGKSGTIVVFIDDMNVIKANSYQEFVKKLISDWSSVVCSAILSHDFERTDETISFYYFDLLSGEKKEDKVRVEIYMREQLDE